MEQVLYQNMKNRLTSPSGTLPGADPTSPGQVSPLPRRPTQARAAGGGGAASKQGTGAARNRGLSNPRHAPTGRSQAELQDDEAEDEVISPLATPAALREHRYGSAPF